MCVQNAEKVAENGNIQVNFVKIVFEGVIDYIQTLNISFHLPPLLHSCHNTTVVHHPPHQVVASCCSRVSVVLMLVYTS